MSAALCFLDGCLEGKFLELLQLQSDLNFGELLASKSVQKQVNKLHLFTGVYVIGATDHRIEGPMNLHGKITFFLFF